MSRNNLPAFVLVDSLLVSSDPEAGWNAYVQAHTFIRFLEQWYGPSTIAELLARFRSGAMTDAALRDVTGKTVVELDGELRAWGLTNAAAFVDRTPWPYMHLYSLGIDPKVRQGITWSKEGGR